jgi:hypothetical protein
MHLAKVFTLIALLLNSSKVQSKLGKAFIGVFNGYAIKFIIGVGY